jgi:hypothetical protein
VFFGGFDIGAAEAADEGQDKTEGEETLEEQYHRAEAGGARRACRDAPVAPFEQSNAPIGQMKPLAVPASKEKFLELIKAFGTKMNIQLAGSDNYSDWLQKLQKLWARLKWKAVLTGEGIEMVDEGLWEQMKGTIEDIILGSIPQNMRAEMAKLKPYEMMDYLAECFAKKGYIAVTTAALDLLDITQGKMSMSDYISEFERLRSKCALAGAGYRATIEVPVLIKGLDAKYREKAFEELYRQTDRVDLEAINQALIRAEAFDVEQKKLALKQHNRSQQPTYQRQSPVVGRGVNGVWRGQGRGIHPSPAAVYSQSNSSFRHCSLCDASSHSEAFCFRRG